MLVRLLLTASYPRQVRELDQDVLSVLLVLGFCVSVVLWFRGVAGLAAGVGVVRGAARQNSRRHVDVVESSRVMNDALRLIDVVVGVQPDDGLRQYPATRQDQGRN